LNVVDIVILIALLVGAYSGFKKGLLMEVISLGAFFVAIIMGIKMLDWGMNLLSDHIQGYDNLLPIISFTVIFISIIVLLNILGKALKRVLDMTLLGNLDDVAGSLMGIVKWALFISIFLWIYESFGGGISDETTKTSILFGPISSFAPGLFRMFSGLYPFFIDFFDQSRELIRQKELTT